MTNLGFLMSDEDKPKQGFAIMDLSQIALATTIKTIGEEKLTLGMMRHIVLNSIRHNALKFKKEGYTEIILGVDNPLPQYWRRDIAYYYKKNRAKAREASTFDWESYFSFMKIIIQELKDNMPYIVCDIQTAEADDVIGVLSKYLSDQGHKVLIISSDGDFTQLQKFKNVSQYSAIQKKFIKFKNSSPEHDLLVKIVKGDKKDGISSIKTRSDYWLTRIEGERSPSIKTSFITELLESDDPLSLLDESEAKRFLENKQLLDLTMVREDIAKEILECYNGYQKKGRKRVYSYFVKSGLSKLLKDINDF